MDTSPNTKGESIRISSQIKNKLKKGDEEGYKKINGKTKKYEPSTIVVWGVSYYDLSDLILLNGTIRDFEYAQALEFLNKIMEILKN